MNIINQTAKKALKKAGSIKDKVIDVTSDILSAPKRGIEKMKSDDADYKYNKIIENRRLKQMDEDGVPDKGNESDPLFRYRINEINKAFDMEQKRKEQSKSLLRSLKDRD